MKMMLPNKFISILRGIWQLRDHRLVRLLGILRANLLEIERIAEANPGAVLDHDVVVQGLLKDNLRLKNGVRIEKGTVLALGDDLNGYGDLQIESNTWIGQYNNLRLAANANIKIGENCLVSQFCSLVAANHSINRNHLIRDTPVDNTKAGITIGNNVWLGAGCVILPGVTLGDGVVIGANSVVNKSVPPYEIWAGAPAGKIGERK